MGFLIFGVASIGLLVALSAAVSRRSTHRGGLSGKGRWGGVGGAAAGTDAFGWVGDTGGGSGGGDCGAGGGGDGGGGGC
ncbi:hypothetical protein [Streptomyces sp. 184]|uniref:hypothetical protein n=1 Tax=Streptomyces sp. 184 TaxID=1827526 RepID=UPI0038924C4D